jgi:WD40 repeat protein
VSWSHDGTLLASASGDKTVRIWNGSTGKQEKRLEGHSNPVLSVCWSPDGTLLASASHDNTVRIWNGSTGKEEQRQSLEEQRQSLEDQGTVCEKNRQDQLDNALRLEDTKEYADRAECMERISRLESDVRSAKEQFPFDIQDVKMAVFPE